MTQSFSARLARLFAPTRPIRTHAARLSVSALEAREMPAFVGVGTGLVGNYFSDTTLTALAATRLDAGVNFDWPAAPVAGVPADGFSVRWSGRVQAQFSETYTFSVASDEGVRLSVGGDWLIDAWANRTPGERAATVSLKAGEVYDLNLETVDTIGAANVRLDWSSPSTPKQIVPASQLYAGGGWIGGDLGVGTPAGAVAGTAAALTVRGAGAVGGSADQGYFASQFLTGDGSVTARVESRGSSAAGGVMLRAGDGTGAAFAAVVATPAGVVFQSRSAAGAAAVMTAPVAASAQPFVQVVRNSTLVAGYVSDSGAAGTWKLVGTATLPLGTSADAGVVVGSSDGQLAAVHFGAVAVATSVPVGANLDAVNDWSLSNAFVDIFKQSREFKSLANGQKAAAGPNGWPTGDFETIIQSGFLNTAKVYNGVYKLSFTGRADLALSVTPGSIGNVRYDAASNKTTADITLNASDSDGGWYFVLQFRNTSGLSNVRLTRPGYAHDTAQVFTSQFLDQLRAFTTLRFMDWNRTNNSPVVNWSERTLPTSPSQTTENGVAYEYMVQLANETGKDLWITLPGNSTPDYARQVAALIKGSLNADRAVYVEYSNEVWNGMFTQTADARRLAIAEVEAGMASGTPSDLFMPGETAKNADGTWLSSWDWTFRRVARSITEISKTFAEVWGQDAMGGRVRPVLASQGPVPYILKTQLEYIDRVHGAPKNFLYGAAGAPYFFVGDADKSRTDLTPTDILNGLVADIPHANATVDDYSYLTTYYGLKNLAYEGGPDTFGGNNIAAKKAASLDPRMKDVVAGYLEDWFAKGGGLFNWFVAGPTNYDTPYGTWGVTNDITNPNAPKALGVEQIRHGAYIAPTVGAPVVGEVLARDYVAGANPTSDPYPRYLNNGDYRDYLVRAPRAGTYSLAINYAQVDAGGQLQVLVNDRVIETLTLPATGPGYDAAWAPNTFADSQALTVVLNEGLNVVRLRVVQKGYTLYSLKFNAAGVTVPPVVPPVVVVPPTVPPVSPPVVSPPTVPPVSDTVAVDYSAGFAGATLARNGSAAVVGSRLRLAGGLQQAGSAYTVSTVDVTRFDAAFRFQLGSLNGDIWSIGDGLTFVLQAAGTTALGATGGGLGLDGVAPAVAVRLNAVGNTMTIAAGAMSHSVNLWGADLNLRSGNVFRTAVSYNGTTLTVTLTDTVTGKSASVQAALNLAGVLGRSTAHAGFTAGTGVLAGTIDVLDWTLSGSTTTVPPVSPPVVPPVVVNEPPTVSATGSTFVAGTSVALGANGADDGGESALRYTWTVVSAPAGGSASFSATGTNAAKSATATFTAAGAYTLRVTATDAGGLTATSDLTITVARTLTTLSVTPGTAGVAAGSTLQLSVTGADQFGRTMLTMPAVTWTVSGGGTVSAGGLYAAPNAAAHATVTVSAGGKTATASIVVSAPVVPPPAPPGGGVSGLSRNGSAALSGDRLRLTSAKNQAGSAYAASADDVSKFSSSFRFQMGTLDGSPWSLGDGLAFVLQTGTASALGSGGSGLGYAGIAGAAVAVRFDILSNSIRLVGAGATQSFDLYGPGIDLRSGNVFRVDVGNDGSALTVKLTDTVTGKSGTARFAANVAAALGASARVGVSAGTAALAGTMDVFDWNYAKG